MKQHSFRRLWMAACSAVVIALALSGFSRASAAEHNLSNLRILIVGNSLSIDCSEYLPAVCKSCGYSNVMVGNCYIRARSLKYEWNTAEQDIPEYSYRTCRSGSSWSSIKQMTLKMFCPASRGILCFFSSSAG